MTSDYITLSPIRNTKNNLALTGVRLHRFAFGCYRPLTMSVLIETSAGDLVVDLLVDYAPKLCEKYEPSCADWTC